MRGKFMPKDNESSTAGMSLFGTLLIIFVVLKLAGLVSWPWVWVLTPLWILPILVLALGLVATVVALIRNLKK
jgi:hypothetical protein